MVLPEGFAIPPLPYLIPTLATLIVASWLLLALRPAVTDRVVLAVVPWMVAGAGGHVLYVVDALPAMLAPLFGVPAVYLTMGALAATVWLLAEVTSSTRTYQDPAWYLSAVGTVAAVVVIGAVGWWGTETGTLEVVWPAVAVVASVALTVAVWMVVSRYLPETANLAGTTGIVVVFGHGLDGISTAIGIDILDGAERSPIADAVIVIGSRLPTAPYFGDTWLFVVVKFALAIAVLALFRDYLREAPSQARLLLAIIAAVGLGPGVHNVLLFTLSI